MGAPTCCLTPPPKPEKLPVHLQRFASNRMNTTPTRIAVAAQQALESIPQPRPSQPVKSEPAAPSNAMAAMATALSTAENEGVNGQQKAVKDNVLSAPCAGEDAGGALDARPNEKALRNRKLAVLVGSRIAAARELTGLQQLEFSKAIGHATPAQPSLWESGRRLLPLADVPAVARALGVSSDFLLGLSDEPERDPAVARRALLARHLRDQLETVAGHLADAALVSGAEIEGAMRATGLLTKALAMQRAVDRFEAANAPMFDDLPCGALLRFAARELAEAVGPVTAELEDVAERRARAAMRAKQVMQGTAIDPEKPASEGAQRVAK